MKEEKLAQIFLSISENERFFINHGGLLGGSSGVLLFLAYYFKFSSDPRAKVLIQRIIEKQLKDISFDNIRYSDGISGILWTHLHINKECFPILDSSHFADQLLRQLYKYRSEILSSNNLDFLHGLIGLEMFTSSLGDEEFSKGILGIVKESMIEDCGGCFWYESLSPEEKVINTSLAHGQASIINFLTEQYSKSKLTQDALILPMIKKAIRFLENNKLENEISVYPSIIRMGTSKSSRLAWCYGDLSISCSYLYCAKVTNDQKLLSRAIHIALNSCSRKKADQTLLQDLGFCHGSSGLAQMYAYFYRNTGIVEFDQAANYWMNYTIDRLFTKDLKYKAFDSQYGWTESYGLINGLAGIGLTLISHLEPTLSSWEQVFYLKPISYAKARDYVPSLNSPPLKAR